MIKLMTLFFFPQDKDDDESDDSIDWGSDSDESSSSSDEDYADIRSKFLKKTTDKDDAKEKKKIERGLRQRKNREKEEEGDDGEGWSVVTGGAQVERPKMFPKDSEINTPAVIKKLAEITAIRGKKVKINKLYAIIIVVL